MTTPPEPPPRRRSWTPALAVLAILIGGALWLANHDTQQECRSELGQLAQGIDGQAAHDCASINDRVNIAYALMGGGALSLLLVAIRR